MEKYGYPKPVRPQGKRTVFKDEGDVDVVEVTNMSVGEKEGSPSHKATLKRKEYHKDARLKSWRLIIRNLPFKTTREEMQNVCSSFGSFTDIVLPTSKKMPGRIAGFAFIQFKTRESAEKAREFFNNNKFKGRMVAADWALPKDTYETATEKEREQLKKKVKLEEDNDVKIETPESPSSMKQEKQHSVNNAASGSNDDDEELSDEEVSEDSSGDEEGESMDIENQDEVENEEEEGSDVEDNLKRRDSAVDEQRVVFLRNLSFNTTNETLKAEMEKFGEVKLAICCKFRDSGHPKGTAFVHFSTPEEAKTCIEATENGLEIDGRDIKGSIAIQRENAAEIRKMKSVKVPEDKRNLRLIRFALIREGTSAAKGMSSEDAAKRQRLAEQSKKKLENLHICNDAAANYYNEVSQKYNKGFRFVSPTRLMIHNLPSSLTDEKLKKICRDAAGNLSHITECRIWKDTSKLDSKGNPRSKGFAFVNFTEHKDALQCLQKLNNNPHTFTNERRPIVEFSIENLLAIKAKARRAAHSKGETLTGRELSEKVKQQVKKSISEVHGSGMKIMPKFLGKKLRHKNMSKTQLKKKNLGKKKVTKQANLTSDVGVKKSKVKSKKQVTKYLALSS